jgi:Fe-S-cluster containining protein
MKGKDDMVIQFLEENKELLNTHMLKILPIFKGRLKDDGIQGLMEYANQYLDAIHEKVDMAGKTTCSSGCSFCCYTDINLSTFEASYINAVIEHYDIKVDEVRLKKQQTKKWHRLKHNDKRCVMLSEEGSCMIYDYRPVICRLWNSTEEPKHCDSKGQSQSTRTARVVEAWAVALVLFQLDSEEGVDTRGLFLHKLIEL